MTTLRQPSFIFQDDLERSPSPTGHARLRQESMGFIFGDADFRLTHIEDKSEGMWSRIAHTKYIQHIRKYLRQRAQNDYILCCLPKKNLWRKRIKSLVNSRWFNWSIGLIVLIHCILLAALYIPYMSRDYHSQNLNVVYVTVLFELLYIAEAILRIIAAGLIMHPLSYLRKVQNVLDVVVIISGLIFILGRQGRTFELFSAFMSLRLIRVLLQFNSVQFIFRALASSFLPLLHLSWLTLCVMGFFALIGLELFRGSLHNGCYVDYTDYTKVTKSYRVSEYPCSNDVLIPVGSHRCTDISNRSYCDTWSEGPNSGLVGFDNFGTALLTVLQCITLEGWTSVLYLYESVYGTLYVWIYFLMLISFGSIFMLNLLLGVLTSVFIGVSDQQEARGRYRILKEKKKIKEDLNGYRHWLNIGLSEEDDSTRMTRSRSLQRQLSRYASEDSFDSVIWSDSEEEEFEEEERNEMTVKTSKWEPFILINKRVRSLVRHFVKSHAFFWFMIIVISTNFILLAADFYPTVPKWEQSRLIINYIYTGVYIFEFILKFYGLGPKIYFASPFNRFDCFCTLVNILDLVVLLHIKQIYFSISEIINVCRAIRIISAFKYTRYWEGMKAIITTFSGVWITILSVLALLTAFVVFVALCGMRLIGTRLSVAGLGHPSFNNFIDAFLLVFQLTTTEDWNSLMYRTAGSYNHGQNEPFSNTFFIALSYVVIIIVGGFVIVNIFLAIAVDKLSEVKAVKEDSSHRSEQREEKRRERGEQLLALKNSSQPSSITQTLRRVLVFYSASLQQQQDQQRRRKRSKRKRSLLSEPPKRVARSFSVGMAVNTASIRRSSYGANRAISDPVKRTELDDIVLEDNRTSLPITVVPKKVHLKNPLGRVLDRLGHSTKESNVPTPQGNPIELTRLDAEAPPIEESATHQLYDLAQVESQLLSDSLESGTEQGSSRRGSNRPQSAKQVERKFSDALDSLEFERTQSLPCTTVPSEISIKPGNGGATPLVNPTHTDPVVSPEDASIARLVRKSSLEEIDPIPLPGDDEYNTRETERQKRYEVLLKCRSKVMTILHWLYNYLGTIELDPRNELKQIPPHSSFFILAPDNRFRVWCYKLVKAKAFQTITFTVIFLSSVILALETPLPVTSQLFCSIQQTIVFFDIVFLIWFTFEFALKIVVLGVFIHRGSYYHGLFNIVDFFVVVTTCIPIVIFFWQHNIIRDRCLSYSYNIPISINLIRVIRVFRVLRPLRALRVEGLFLVIQGIFASLRRMVYVFFVGILIMLIFAVIGVHLFKGRFFYCSDLITSTEEDCHGEYFTYPTADLNCPKVLTRMWKRWSLYFDHIGWSFLSLYTMITKEGWQEIMYHAIDAAGINKGPRHNASQYSLIYFIIYMVIVTFFLINLLVGFVIVTFQDVGIKSFKDSNLDRNQRNCLYVALTSNPHKKYIPKYSCHAKLYQLVHSWIFRAVILITVFVNIIVLAIQHYDMNETVTMAIYWTNVGFTVLFALEALFKLVVLTPAHYFRSLSRGFEFLIVLASLLELILQRTVSLPNTLWRYSHIASSLRVLRLIQITKNTKLILWTILRSLEIFPWVGVLMIVLLYTYALTGIQLFGQIEVASIDKSATNAIHQFNNFENFPQAVRVMIRCFTGENWQQIMLSSVSASCALNSVYNNTVCGSNVTYFFYPSFFFISSILVLNLFVAILIDNFDYFIRDKAILGSHNLTEFPALWAKKDPTASGKIHHNDVIEMMRSVNPPLGWGRLCPQLMAYKRMMALNIPLDEEGQVTFNATLFAIVRHTLAIDVQELRNKLQSLFPSVPKRTLDNVLPERPEWTTGREYAALLVQQYWRKWKLDEQRRLSETNPQRRINIVFRRVPDMGPTLLQRRLTVINLGNNQLELPDVSPASSPNLVRPHLSPEEQLASSPSHSPSPTPVLPVTQRSFLTRLATIKESNSDTMSPTQLSSSPSPVPSPQHRLSPATSPPMVNRRFSNISESDTMFATPTGSLVSLETDELKLPPETSV